jgi:hypothetical protein
MYFFFFSNTNKQKRLIPKKKGYRRNNPSLRRQPSIGLTTIGIQEIIPFGRFSAIGCGKPYALHCRCKFDQPCRCHNQNKLCPCVKA